jgi:hypothetical protein
VWRPDVDARSSANFRRVCPDAKTTLQLDARRPEVIGSHIEGEVGRRCASDNEDGVRALWLRVVDERDDVHASVDRVVGGSAQRAVARRRWETRGDAFEAIAENGCNLEPGRKKRGKRSLASRSELSVLSVL